MVAGDRGGGADRVASRGRRGRRSATDTDNQPKSPLICPMITVAGRQAEMCLKLILGPV